MLSTGVGQLSHWVQAARPLALLNLAVPLCVGHAVAVSVMGTLSARLLWASLLWAWLAQLFIVFFNDYLDRHTDTPQTTLVSGGSGVIAQGKLAATSIRTAALVSFTLLSVWTAAIAARNRPYVIVATLVTLVLMWAYSARPLKLSFRGGGEILQGFGVGVVVVWVGYYMQSNDVALPMALGVLGFCLGVAGNITTALPDVPVDSEHGKRTLAVRWSVRAATIAAAALILVPLAWSARRGAPTPIAMAGFAACVVAVVNHRRPLAAAIVLSVASLFAWLGLALAFSA